MIQSYRLYAVNDSIKQFLLGEDITSVASCISVLDMLDAAWSTWVLAGKPDTESHLFEDYAECSFCIEDKNLVVYWKDQNGLFVSDDGKVAI